MNDDKPTVELTITGPWREVRALVLDLCGDEVADMLRFELDGSGHAKGVIVVRKAAQ